MGAMPEAPALPLAAEIDVRGKTFASGLLLDLIAALRSVASGELIGLTAEPAVVDDLETWSRLTGHAIVARSGSSPVRLVIRRDPTPGPPDEERPLGSRIWLYTNFDCNLCCDYCCVRSSPRAPRRELGLARIERIAREAAPLGVREFFITGGEPFLLPDIAEIIETCAAVAKTTVLTNGMLFKGPRRAALARLARDRVVLQISLDSPTPPLHDRHRGSGTWQRALEGIEFAREEGFRVRLAATVDSDEDEAAFRAFLDGQGVPLQDRVIRRVALRGFARSGTAVGRDDLVPELTITAEGVYWHPVGADDLDLLVSREIFPLAAALAAARHALDRQREQGHRLAQLFYCA